MTYKGIQLDFNDREKWISIIGSREPSKEEVQMAYAFGKKCAEKGMVVVSGLADGIDTAAHQGALAGGGYTLAVVSTSPGESIYPRSNIQLANAILKQGGILYPFETKAKEKEKSEKGMSQFQKRLIERDVLVAYLTPRIFTVKDTEEPISGGTKWAMNYGQVFGKDLYRVDSRGKIHQNPSIEKSKVFWDMEMNVENVFVF